MIDDVLGPSALVAARVKAHLLLRGQLAERLGIDEHAGPADQLAVRMLRWGLFGSRSREDARA